MAPAAGATPPQSRTSSSGSKEDNDSSSSAEEQVDTPEPSPVVAAGDELSPEAFYDQLVVI